MTSSDDDIAAKPIVPSVPSEDHAEYTDNSSGETLSSRVVMLTAAPHVV